MIGGTGSRQRGHEGADLVGRSAALLADLSVDLQPSGWRFTDRPGRDLARTRSFLRRDLDELAEVVGQEPTPEPAAGGSDHPAEDGPPGTGAEGR